MRVRAPSRVIIVMFCIAFLISIAAVGLSHPRQVAGALVPIDLNDAVRGIADAQGVVPGSVEWCNGGAWAYGGTTGGHPFYGWRHTKRLASSDLARRAAIANAAHRPQFYWGDGIWFRSDYEGAGRPKSWKNPGAPNTDWGSVRYLVPTAKLGSIGTLYPEASPGIRAVDVYGLEAMHWWPETLIDLARFGDARGWRAPIDSTKDASAGEIARSILTVQITSIVGALNGAYESRHFGNERWAARLIEGALGAADVGALLDSNASTVANWLDNGALPELAVAPGCSLFPGNRPSATPPVPSGRQIALVWQWAWCGAAFARLARDYPAWAPRALPVAKRYLRWVVDAADAAGGRIPTLVSFDPGALGKDGTPVMDSIAPLLKAGRAGVHDEYDFSVWCYRPLRFAASLGIPGASNLASKIGAATPHTDANAPWMVDDFNNYVWPELASLNSPYASK